MMSLKQQIFAFYQKKPLLSILFVGFLVRLIAVFFSKGYGMSDDHFLVIEKAQELLIGIKSDFWTPYEDGTGGKSKRSLFYPYLHYLLFYGLESIKVVDPQVKMWVVRFLHALYSLLAVFFTFRITELLSNKELARKTTWVAALIWFLPMLSVRNLIEVVSLPLLMAGSYYSILGHLEKQSKRIFLIAGICFGFAFSIRYQTAAFGAGIGLFLLFHKNWKGALLLTLGGIIPLVLNHLVLESYMFGYPPFGKVMNYINFNLENANSYIVGPWYQFVALMLGLFIPTFSFIMMVGLFKAWRKYLILFLPFMLFFAFHSVFPNKQERFILPVVLFFPILGFLGYELLLQGQNWFSRNPRFFRVSWRVFWVLNIVLLSVISTTYTKRSKVEAMYYLSKKPIADRDVILFSGSKRADIATPPLYYMGTNIRPYRIQIGDETDLNNFVKSVDSLKQVKQMPDYLLIYDKKALETKLPVLEEVFPEMEFEKKIEASFIDRLLHWLNPINKNYDILIYRCYPEKE